MADSAALLRMLEPTVRPVQTPGGAKPAAAQLPLEQRPFESLLAEARETAPPGSTSAAQGAHASAAPPEAQVGTEATAAPARPLSPLHGLEQVENASLRRLMAQGELTPSVQGREQE